MLIPTPTVTPKPTPTLTSRPLHLDSDGEADGQQVERAGGLRGVSAQVEPAVRSHCPEMAEMLTEEILGSFRVQRSALDSAA
jgi:hypothetical protein